MKKIYLSILACFCSLGLFAQTLNIASYNIRYNNPKDAENGNGWAQRCPAMSQQIQFNDFDIWGGQEVVHNQLNDLLDNLPQYGYIGVGRDDGATKGEYAPIFYKKDQFEVLQSGTFWMSPNTDYPNKGWDADLPRICTWGEFKTEGRQFWFFNLHMDHIGVEARRESAKLILAKIQEMCGDDPVILTGDFNVDQDNESYTLLQKSDILDDCYVKTKVRYALNGTFNNFDPNALTDRRIDHIFVTPSIDVLRYGILTDTYRMGTDKTDASGKKQYVARVISDHFPIVVQLQFKP